MEEFGVTHTTSGRSWTVEQDIQDRSTDREDVPPGMRRPNTADRLHQSCVTIRPDTEAPHTRSASQMNYWIMNSPKGSSPSISNHTMAQPILQYGLRISSSTSTWPEETTSMPSKYLPLKLKGPARHWLNSLPENSIGSWEDVEEAFLDNFQGTYVRPPDANDLSHIDQQPRESAKKSRLGS